MLVILCEKRAGQVARLTDNRLILQHILGQTSASERIVRERLVLPVARLLTVFP
jgi:hypothetical protein